jgi:putative ABC transport system permease protein
MLAETDRDTLAPVGVVNEKLVAALFPGQNPIGKRVKIGSPTSPYPWITIVGVVRDYRHYTLPQPMGPAIFTPYAQSPSTSQTFAIRTSRRDPATLTAEVRRVVHDLDPQVAPDNIRTMEDIVGQSLWRQRLQGQVLGTFAALALLLAIVGIYGVISYAVAQRTRDIAVRLALGAQPSQVLGMVLRQGAALAALGIGIGLLAALALSRTLATLLYGVSTTDVVSFAVVPLALASVTMLATYVPARRATRVDPLLAMRAD